MTAFLPAVGGVPESSREPRIVSRRDLWAKLNLTGRVTEWHSLIDPSADVHSPCQ